MPVRVYRYQLRLPQSKLRSLQSLLTLRRQTLWIDLRPLGGTLGESWLNDDVRGRLEAEGYQSDRQDLKEITSRISILPDRILDFDVPRDGCDCDIKVGIDVSARTERNETRKNRAERKQPAIGREN